MVEKEWREIRGSELKLPDEELNRITAYFAPPKFESLSRTPDSYLADLKSNEDFSLWCQNNLADHIKPGYSIVNISLKPEVGIPGDASADQMDAVAELADQFSFGEIRVTHEQNLVLAHVKQKDLLKVWQGLVEAKLATANLSLVTDIICCPGLDYCGLATARSIPIAQQISSRFAEIKQAQDIGELRLNISGCINACGHHHVGNIGILGVDKKNKEFYQITLGGHGEYDASIGDIIGPAVASDQIVDAIEKVVNTYLAIRKNGEKFIETYRRVGIGPFKENVYADH